MSIVPVGITRKLSRAVVKKTNIHVTLSMFNRPRPCCIFQQWGALDGNFHSTAVKAFQRCITQHVIQSWSWIFTHLLLTYYGAIIRAASWTLKTERNREKKRDIHYTWYKWLELATATRAHFVPTPVRLWGEPITTFLGQNNLNSPLFPWARTRSSEENVQSLVPHSVSPTDTRWNHTSPAFITC